MLQLLPLQVSDDLTVAIGGSEVRLSASQALDFSEQLARKGFRRLFIEEANDLMGETSVSGSAEHR